MRLKFMGYRQAVRQRVLISSCAGSNPAIPAIFTSFVLKIPVKNTCQNIGASFSAADHSFAKHFYSNASRKGLE